MSAFYAVRRGRTPGIYTDWNVAKHEVLGWPGSEHKRFPTRDAALAWMAVAPPDLTHVNTAGLSPDQVEALRLSLDDKRPAVFLTGAAGTGKSCTLERIITSLRSILGRKRVIVTAATGVAAANIGGTTLHRAMGIGIARQDAKVCVARMKGKTKVVWHHAQVLVIDEVSMLHAWWLDQCDAVLRIVKGMPRSPFGGLRVIFCGDFLQLPPIGNENLVEFAFQSAAWRAMQPVRAQLTHVHRSENPRFTEVLAAVRLARLSPDDEAFLAARVAASRDATENIVGATYLYPTNAEVDGHNARELAKLPGPEMHFEAKEETGETTVLDTIPAPHLLVLKQGAAVLLLINMDVRAKQFNGARATVEQMTAETVTVRLCETAQVLELSRHYFTVEKGDTVLAKRRQFPLRLAYAITSHRAQGMTLTCPIVASLDKRVFEFGMAYSILSRAKRPEQIILRAFRADCIRAHPAALAFETSHKD